MKFFILDRNDIKEPVDKAAPFLYNGIQLFVWYYKKNREFQVIEATTGLLVSRGDTEEETIELAKENINQTGIDRTKEIIIKQQERLGFKPIPAFKNSMVL